MAFDSQRKRVALIGGKIQYFQSSPNFEIIERTVGDAGEWNGQQWILRAESACPPVRAHSLTWDPQRQRVIMFGGRNNLTVFRQTREWTGSALPVIDAHGPSARYGHAMAFDSVTQQALLFGGRSGQFWKDTWGFGP